MPLSSETDSILQQLKRYTLKSEHEPPDSARATIGQRLAISWLKTIAQEEGDKIVATLVQKNIHLSVVTAFCVELEQQPDIPLPWISQWITLSEQVCLDHEGSFDCLYALIRLFVKQSTKSLDYPTVFPELYFKLQRPATRVIFIRQLTDLAFTENKVQTILSPLMACILSHLCPLEERLIFLQGTFRECHRRQEKRIHIVDWLLRGLDIHLLGAQGTQQKQLIMEISFQWLLSVTDLIRIAMSSSPNDQDWGPQLSIIITNILPHFFNVDCKFSFEQFWSDLNSADKTHVDEECVLQLAIFSLSTPFKAEVLGILTLLDVLTATMRITWISKLMLTLACIFDQDNEIQDIARMIYQHHSTLKTSGKSTDILQYFGSHSGDRLHFITHTINSIDKMDATKVSVLNQNGLFILSCVLGFDYIDNMATSLTITLLQKFPWLGISMLPVLLKAIQESTSGSMLQSRLNFLCDSVVHDPHCAQEVWNLVGVSLVDKHSPTEVRAMSIRFYPTLVAKNRRLYRRVTDSIGSMIEERNSDIRLAIAATIRDLAESDLIRDVSDVIGWVQTYLTDENPSVVYLAIMTLHHLIRNGELDFDVVFKVLNKRICPMGDVNQVLELDLLVIEAVAVFLGDGELAISENDTVARREYSVSAQGQSAVRTLVLLAISNRLNTAIGSPFSQSICRMRFHIFKSLTNYSLSSLGLEEESIRAATNPLEEGVESIPEAGRQYKFLKDLTLQEVLTVDSNIKDHPAILLARMIVHAEEDALGTLIWQKGLKPLSSRKAKASTRSKHHEQGVMSILPDPEKVARLFDEQPSSSASIACLLAFNGKDCGRLLDYAGDLGNETLNPVRQLLTIQGWLHAMAKTWSSVSSSAELDDIIILVKEIRGWYPVLGKADYSYFALSCLALYMPQTFPDATGCDLTLAFVVEDIHSSVEQGVRSHEFHSKDNAYLSLAFVAARALDVGSVSQFKRILDTLEDAAQNGEESFGAWYGISILVQSLSSSILSGTSDAFFTTKQRDATMCKSIATLIDCTNLLAPKHPARISFSACVRSGKTTTDLAKSLSLLTPSSVGSQQDKFESLMTSFAICGPALTSLNPELGWALLHYLIGFQTGTLHSFALSSVYESCRRAQCFEQKDKIDFESHILEVLMQRPQNFSLVASLQTGNAAEPVLTKSHIEQLIAQAETDPNLLLYVIPLVTTLPVISLGDARFRAVARPKIIADKASMSFLMDKISSVAFNRSESLVGYMATIIYGILASLQLPVVEIYERSGTPLAVSYNPVLFMDLSRLPVPLEQSLLSGLLTGLRESLPRQDIQASVLSCLHSLSLPSQFVSALLDPIIMDARLTGTALKDAAIDLLLSQCSGRRRAAFDGRDFSGLASRIAAMDSPQLRDLLGCASHSLLSSINHVALKSSAETIFGVLDGSWRSCLLEGPQVILSWLSAIHSVLQDVSSRSIGHKMLNDIRRFVVNDLFLGLVTLDDDTFSVVGIKIVECLRAVPLEMLDEQGKFFAFSENDNFIAASRGIQCSMELIQSGYVESKTRTLSILLSAVAWFMRVEANKCSASSRQRAGMSIAIATATFDNSTKEQALMLILEGMLVHGASLTDMSLIGALTAKWNYQTGNGTTLSTLLFTVADRVPTLDDTSIDSVTRAFVNALPVDIGAIAAKSGKASIFSNRFHRILGVYTKSQSADRMLMRCLHMSLFCLAHEGLNGALEMAVVTTDFLNTPYIIKDLQAQQVHN